MDRRSSKIIWDSMKSKFGGNARVKRSLLQKLRRDFDLVEMNETECVEEYFTRVLSVTNQMRSNGEVMMDSKVVDMYIVVSIEESKDTETMSLEELQSSLMVHEQKFKKLDKGDDHVLKVTHDRGMETRGRGSYGRGRGRGRGRTFRDKSTVECYKCHRLGHFKSECPKWEEEEANYADEEEEMLLMAYIEEETEEDVEMAMVTQTGEQEDKRRKAWFLDSGCSNHMSGDQELFTSLNTNFKHSVKLGNDKTLEVVGKGNVKFILNSTTYTISDVYYIPELKNNLLSHGQLQEKDVTIIIQKGVCKMYHEECGLIAESKMSRNRMFMIIDQVGIGELRQQRCLQTTTEDTTKIWHERYGHLSFSGMKTLQSKEMVRDLPCFDTQQFTCTDCLVGKQSRNPIPKKSTWRAK